MTESVSKSDGSSNTQLSTSSHSSESERLNSSRSSKDSDSYVKVGVRVRPIGTKENHYAVSNTIKFRGDDFVVQCPRTPWTMHGQEHIFQYDHMFWSCDSTYEFSTQEDVYQAMGKPMVERLFSGYNASLFVYGQVGSGKTYTMIGLDDIDDPSTSGILPRLARELFAKLEGRDSSSYSIEVTNYEIYKEKIYDLLGPAEDKVSLRVREHPNKGPYIEQLTTKVVSDYEELRECIKTGQRNRMCCPNPLNEKSSKSHSIFCVKLRLRVENETYRVGSVSLVDLAGSERLQHGLPEEHLVSINRSLFTLGKVISALSQRKKGNTFVSYRDSVLTWLLRQSLGGNSLTSMIATITPSSSKVMETLATLRYVKQARLIINPATTNDVEESATKDGKLFKVTSANAGNPVYQESDSDEGSSRTEENFTTPPSSTLPTDASKSFTILTDSNSNLVGAGDVPNENSSDNASYDSIQSLTGPLSKSITEDVIRNYLKENINMEGTAVNMHASWIPEEVMACFTSMYELITKLKPMLCEEEFLINAYADCKNSIHKFERTLCQHMSKRAVEDEGFILKRGEKN